MSEVNEQVFAAIVKLIQSREAVYSADQTMSRSRVEREAHMLAKQLSDAQLKAVVKWEQERVNQGELELAELREKLKELEVEAARRASS